MSFLQRTSSPNKFVLGMQDFIINQDWMDPKSQLQQCVLMLREQGKTPELPIYKYVTQIRDRLLRDILRNKNSDIIHFTSVTGYPHGDVLRTPGVIIDGVTYDVL